MNIPFSLSNYSFIFSFSEKKTLKICKEATWLRMYNQENFAVVEVNYKIIVDYCVHIRVHSILIGARD